MSSDDHQTSLQGAPDYVSRRTVYVDWSPTFPMFRGSALALRPLTPHLEHPPPPPPTPSQYILNNQGGLFAKLLLARRTITTRNKTDFQTGNAKSSPPLTRAISITPGLLEYDQHTWAGSRTFSFVMRQIFSSFIMVTWKMNALLVIREKVFQYLN